MVDRLGLTDDERRLFEDELRVTMAANAQKKEEFMYALGLTDEERRQIESDLAQDQTGLNSEQEQENEQEKETEKIAEKASAQCVQTISYICLPLHSRIRGSESAFCCFPGEAHSLACDGAHR